MVQRTRRKKTKLKNLLPKKVATKLFQTRIDATLYKKAIVILRRIKVTRRKLIEAAILQLLEEDLNEKQRDRIRL